MNDWIGFRQGNPMTPPPPCSKAAISVFICMLVSSSLAFAQENQPADVQPVDQDIDFRRARQLLRKSRSGEKLTQDEQAYLNRARQFRKKQLKSRRPGPRPAAAGKDSVGLSPLTDAFDSAYKGQNGGLYGDGKNEPPPEHLAAALRAAGEIRPLDAAGNPDPEGEIVLISSGMSNVTQEFQQFMRFADIDPVKSPQVVIVDGAQGGQEASDWAYPEKRHRKDRPNAWDVLQRRLQQAGVTSQQVQVLWLKQARRNPASLGEFPKHAEVMKQDLTVVLNEMKRRFPNLQLAYLSSRIYAGYASGPLNPEPYAYETAFTMRWLIEEQMAGSEALNFDKDKDKGKVQSPVLLWGPYLWANGVRGRQLDDLVWQRSDFGRDGTHPSASGRKKVAEQLLHFLKTDRTAKTWFVKHDR